MIKLVASDLDGTIINHNNVCSEETVKEIDRIRKMGIAFAISTGRPVASMEHFLPIWGLRNHVDYIIGSNGGEVLDVKKCKYVTTYTLEPEILKDILEKYKDLPMIPTLYYDGAIYVQRVTDQTTRICKLEGREQRVANIKDMIHKPEIKLMYVVEPEDMEYIENYYEDHKDDRYIGFKTASFLFEFTNPRTSKDVGIQILQEILHINQNEIMAFGDTTNDIEMLKYVKYGIAMSNGSSDAKKVAFDICDSVEDDGVAKYLKTHLPTMEYTR